jgi:Leucine-rich repeat (LRR) protein
MAGLQELYMSFNIINSIEDDSFKILNKLVRLDLSNNYLTKLGNDTFAGLFSLTYLNFNNNSIQVVQKSLFRQLINLEELYLSSNPLKLIEDKAFFNLNFLRVLNMDAFDPINSTQVTNSTFTGLSNLRLLVLSKYVLNNFANLAGIVST